MKGDSGDSLFLPGIMENQLEQYLKPGYSLGQWHIIQPIHKTLIPSFLATRTESPLDRENCVSIKIIPPAKFSHKWWDYLGKRQAIFPKNQDAPFMIWKDYGEQQLDIQTKVYYLVTEYASGGTLQDFQQQYPQNKIPTEQFFFIFQQMMGVIQYAHQNKIIHGAIQLDDWYLTPQGWKLGNFDLASLLSCNLGYLAPEILEGNLPTYASDIWSLGICSYLMLTNKLPYYGNTIAEIQNNIQCQSLDWPLDFIRATPDSIHGLLFYLIKQMLQPNQKKRPCIEDIVQSLAKGMLWLSGDARRQYAERISGQLVQADVRPQNEFLRQFSKLPQLNQIPQIPKANAACPLPILSHPTTPQPLPQEGKAKFALLPPSPQVVNIFSMPESQLHADHHPDNPNLASSNPVIKASDKNNQASLKPGNVAPPSVVVSPQYTALLPKYRFAWTRLFFCLLLLVVIFSGLAWYYDWSSIYLDWTGTSTISPFTFHLQAQPEYPDFCWRIGLVTDTGVFPESLHEAQWYIIAQHANGLQQENIIDWETLQQNNLLWEVPLHFPNGKVALCVKAQSDSTQSPLISQILYLDIKKSFEERQAFAKVQELANSLEKESQPFLKVIQAYQDYLKQYPSSYFQTRILAKIQELQDQELKYQYNFILAMTQKQPPPLDNIVARCEEFLVKYPQQPQSPKIQEILHYYRFWMASNEYSVTLVNGSITTFWKADSYVKVFVADKEVFKTEKIANNNHPRWDKNFKISWKSGDGIAVEFWDYDPLNKDDRYFRIEDRGPMAIQLLNGRIGDNKIWLEFAVVLPQKTW